MSNNVINAHVALGEPCGEDADLDMISDWAGDLILSGNGGLNKGQITLLRIIGEYLHGFNPKEEDRKEALEIYYKLYDSITGR